MRALTISPSWTWRAAVLAQSRSATRQGRSSCSRARRAEGVKAMTMKGIRCAERQSRWRLIRMAVLAVAVASLSLAARTAPAASLETKATKVSIVNFQFTPAEVTIAPAESVTWVNDDGAPHGLAYHAGVAGYDLLLPG